MSKIRIIFYMFLVLAISGCATKTKFQQQCMSYGFSEDSADYAVCVERETKHLRDYFERKAAEEEAKNESFYRDLERKRLGLDVK